MAVVQQKAAALLTALRVCACEHVCVCVRGEVDWESLAVCVCDGGGGVYSSLVREAEHAGAGMLLTQLIINHNFFNFFFPFFFLTHNKCTLPRLTPPSHSARSTPYFMSVTA